MSLVLVTWDAYATTLDATHLLTQHGATYKGFAVVSGLKFDGAVSVDNEVHRMVARWM